MTEHQHGPPERERPGPTPETGPNQQVEDHTTTRGNTNAAGRQAVYDVLAGNARRFGASRRMVPIRPCGCVRDPEHDRHVCGDEISDNMAEAAVAAVIRLDELGTPGLLNRETCRAMHRIGHPDLALDVYRRSAGAA